MANDGTGRVKEGVGMRNPFHRVGQFLRLCIISLGKTINLIDAEHGIGFQEGNGLFDFLSRAIGFCLGKRIGVDDG